MSQVNPRNFACYCILLRRAANVVSKWYDQFLEPVGLSVNQFALLFSLHDLGSGSISELACYVGQDRTTLVRTIKPLLDMGLIENTAPAGRRAKSLRLTDQGRVIVRQGIPLWEQAQENVRRQIGPEIADTLLQTLRKITLIQKEVDTEGGVACNPQMHTYNTLQARNGKS